MYSNLHGWDDPDKEPSDGFSLSLGCVFSGRRGISFLSCMGVGGPCLSLLAQQRWCGGRTESEAAGKDTRKANAAASFAPSEYRAV